MNKTSEERAAEVAERMRGTLTKAAESQSAAAIGAAVLAVIEQGQPLSVETIVAFLKHEVERRPNLIFQARNEAAEKELLAAQTKSQS